MPKELHDFQAEYEKDKQKKGQSKRQMLPNNGISVQEARDLILWRKKQKNEEGGVVSSSSAPQASEAPKRAPSKCSNCGIVVHTRPKYPTHYSE